MTPTVLSVSIDEGTFAELIAKITNRAPQKSFGYLLTSGSTVTDYYMFTDNVRNTEAFRPNFERHGRYFVDHDDAGFVASPEDTVRAYEAIASRGLVEVAVFHTHQRHPANFSTIDCDLHRQLFPDLWHLVVSFRVLHMPQYRAFVASPRIREIELRILPRAGGGGR